MIIIHSFIQWVYSIFIQSVDQCLKGILCVSLCPQLRDYQYSQNPCFHQDDNLVVRRQTNKKMANGEEICSIENYKTVGEKVMWLGTGVICFILGSQ